MRVKRMLLLFAAFFAVVLGALDAGPASPSQSLGVHKPKAEAQLKAEDQSKAGKQSKSGTKALLDANLQGKSPPARPSEDENPLKRGFSMKGEKSVELRDLLAQMSSENGFSLIVSRAVRGTLDEIKGVTIEEILNKNLLNQGFDWRFWDRCLYVGEQGSMDELWRLMNTPFKAKVALGKKLSADFHSIELPMVCSILSKFSGVDIRATDGISGRITMRIVEMPWEKVLRGVVYINGYRILESDYTILVSP